MTTPLYYAQVSGITGLSFTVGDVTLFAPCEQDALFVVEASALVITATVPPLMQAHLMQHVIEPRFQALTPGRVAA